MGIFRTRDPAHDAMKPTKEASATALTADEVVKALSYHGAFLKKHVLATIQSIAGLKIFNEEYPSDFGGKTRTSDIVAFDDNDIVFVIECKKVSLEKSWIFLKGIDQRYRVARCCNLGGVFSKFARPSPSDTPICSLRDTNIAARATNRRTHR